jgi:hypothetical protein
MFTIMLIAFLTLILQVFHVYISAPINPGSTISPGIWLSKCGLFSLLPSCTENAYLHFNRNGTLTYYNTDKVVVWIMEGSVCDLDGTTDPTTTTTTTATTCIRGMQIQPDGKVVIGGKHISHVTYYDNKNSIPLSPWPFTETPKVKVWKK